MNTVFLDSAYFYIILIGFLIYLNELTNDIKKEQ